MTREDARYYLQSSGFSEEQIATIEQAFKQEPPEQECRNCKHYAAYDETCFECEYEGITRGYTRYEQELSGDVVSRGVFEQVMWERDVAIEQLKDLGYGLGEKPKTGHWIFEGNQCFSCSSCCRIYTQKAFEYLKLNKDDSDFPNNCPNCGCRMVVPQESEG